MRILVTDGDSRAALAVTRSLGRLGHHVVVAERRSPSLAQASRYCSGTVVYRDPVQCEALFLEDIKRSVRELGIDALVPVAEVTTILLTRHRSEFEPACKLPFATAESIERAADKVDVIRTAQQLGIPVPRTTFLEARDQLDRCLPALSFPVVIKSRRSRVHAGGRWLSSTVSYANTVAELRHDLERRHDAEFPLMLQQKIVGPGMGVFACYDRGSMVALFAHRRLREKPPSGGVAVLCESVEVDERGKVWADQLLRHLKWHGVAMVEFKLDASTGTPVLMEINGRFWGSLQLAIDAGVDFPSILLETLNAHPVTPTFSYRTGIRCRWFWGDVDSLLTRLRRTESGHRQDTWGARLRAVRDFLVMWAPSLYYDNPKPSDFGPWWHETKQWLRTMTNRHS